MKRPNPLLTTAAGNLARVAGESLVDEPGIKDFRSFGKADFHVPEVPAAIYRDANPAVILYGKSAKAEVRLFYPHP